MKNVFRSIALACVALSAAPAAQNLTHVRLESAAAEELGRSFELQGYDVVEGSVRPGSLELVLGDGELATLESLGFTLEVIQVGRPFASMQAELGGTPERPGYPDLAAVQSEMSLAAASFPAICQLVNLNDLYGAPTTAEGRSLFAVKVSDNVAVEEDEPSVMIVGAHHCRETVTPLIALEALSQLTSGYGVDPVITAMVDKYEIWIAPVWNPDGYEYVFTTNNLWRKNRRPNGGNSFGVDLNRNYPFGWNQPCAGSTATNSCTYKGPSAGSEPETQLMMTWSLDQRFAKVLDYHSFGREVLWGYSCTPDPLPAYLQATAIGLANASGYSGSNRPPSAEGEQYEWQLFALANAAYLLETHVAFQPTIASAMAEAVQLWSGIRAFINRPIPISGHVTDSCTGAPLESVITFGSFSYPNGETLSSGGAFGRFDAFLPVGPETLIFTAPGYEPQSIPITVVENATLDLDVALDPLVALSLEGAPAGSSLGRFLEIQAPCPYASGGGAASFALFGTPADVPDGANLSDAAGTLLTGGRLDASGRARLELPAGLRRQDWAFQAVVVSPGGTRSSTLLRVPALP